MHELKSVAKLGSHGIPRPAGASYKLCACWGLIHCSVLLGQSFVKSLFLFLVRGV